MFISIKNNPLKVTSHKYAHYLSPSKGMKNSSSWIIFGIQPTVQPYQNPFP